MSRISETDLQHLIDTQLPWVRAMGMSVQAIQEGSCRVRLPHRDEHLRPGGTISGPAMMGLADYAMYVGVLSAIGRVELAVTTNLSINFLRRPQPAAILADCRMIKVGRRLAYGEVFLYAEGAEDDGPVAHVTSTYSIPPDRDG
ncbi:thioesterase [Rhodovibrio sodomensis]|uniref:Thioesterase n=1 Tax=Rhodovibrio sodomensis TaxID=1088 RepID=A0ABS1DF71_9PROT|nr:PaaI family thioesterase [Rhodovibrio sodomensis]MBK1669121.1 thioesterase [Rhodovibrio sodomensis]